MSPLTQAITSLESVLPSHDSKTITARSKSNFSGAFFFLPQEKRVAMRRVYAFFRMVDDVVDEEPDVARQRELIGLWKEELQRTYQGITLVPLMKELKESIDRFAIPQNYFLKLIEGCEIDITKKRYATFEELYEYCYRVASMVGLVCMKIFEYESPTSEKTAVALGIALQLTNIIRDVGVDLTKSRIYLPDEDLRRFNVTEQDLLAGKSTDNFLKLMEFQYERAMGYYELGMSEYAHDKQHKLLAARLMGMVYQRILKKIRAQRYPVLSRKVKLSVAEKMFILAKALARQYF